MFYLFFTHLIMKCKLLSNSNRLRCVVFVCLYYIISIDIGQNFTAKKGYYIYYTIKNQIRLLYKHYTIIRIGQTVFSYPTYQNIGGVWGLGVYINRYYETTKHKFFASPSWHTVWWHSNPQHHYKPFILCINECHLLQQSTHYLL